MPDLLIREVTYQGEVTDLLLRGDDITPAPAACPAEVQVIAGHGLLAVPGLVDVHVHLRDPGLTEKENC